MNLRNFLVYLRKSWRSFYCIPSDIVPLSIFITSHRNNIVAWAIRVRYTIRGAKVGSSSVHLSIVQWVLPTHIPPHEIVASVLIRIVWLPTYPNLPVMHWIQDLVRSCNSGHKKSAYLSVDTFRLLRAILEGWRSQVSPWGCKFIYSGSIYFLVSKSNFL